MLKPEQVPKEAVVELRAFLNSCDCDDCVAVAIAAAINAWPGVIYKHSDFRFTPQIILPLPQEGGDE